MLKRKQNGAVVCFSCEQLVSATSKTCSYCRQKQPNLWGYAHSLRRLGSDYGFVDLVIKACALLYVATLLADMNGIQHNGFWNLLSPSRGSLFVFGASGSIPVIQHGRWWTLLTAGWLHGNFLHILFNLFWVNYLAKLIADWYRASRLVIIYVFSSVTGALLTTGIAYFYPDLPNVLRGADLTIGASGAVTGLLGAMLSHAQRVRNPELQYRASIYALFLIGLGFISTQNVDNWGHIGGFLGGYLITQRSEFSSRQPQKLWHIRLAAICLFLVLISLTISVIYGLWIIYK